MTKNRFVGLIPRSHGNGGAGGGVSGMLMRASNSRSGRVLELLFVPELDSNKGYIRALGRTK